jgi:1,4-alpha-glucan branching enzyme
MHEKDKLIVFEKGDLLFIFNFHPSQSFEHYRIGTKWSSDHKIILDTDESRFGGKDLLNFGHANKFPIHKEKWMHRSNYIQLYIPSRTGIVLMAEENLGKYDLSLLEN